MLEIHIPCLNGSREELLTRVHDMRNCHSTFPYEELSSQFFPYEELFRSLFLRRIVTPTFSISIIVAQDQCEYKM